LLRDLGRDLLADLVPQTAVARGSERLNLQRRILKVERHRDHLLARLLHLETDAQVLPRHDLHAPQVDIGTHRIRLGLIERPVLGPVRRRGLRVFDGGHVVGRGIGHGVTPSVA